MKSRIQTLSCRGKRVKEIAFALRVQQTETCNQCRALRHTLCLSIESDAYTFFKASTHKPKRLPKQPDFNPWCKPLKIKSYPDKCNEWQFSKDLFALHNSCSSRCKIPNVRNLSGADEEGLESLTGSTEAWSNVSGFVSDVSSSSS